MSVKRKINNRLISQTDTGFSTNGSANGGRFINKNGKPNIVKHGVGFFERFSIYHTLLEIPTWKFLVVIFCYYTIINILFALIYLSIGLQHLNGIVPSTPINNFGEAFFFSAQTFTTVGYGRISPVGFITSTVAAFEAMIGLLTFAIATGLFYGRFSQPIAFIKFSPNAIIAPYKNITALMFRLAPFKNNNLTDAEVRLTLGVKDDENGTISNKFYTLNLEMSKVNSIPLNWTVVHPIDDQSPLYGLGEEDMKTMNAEFVVFIRAFDEAYSNTVITRTSYITAEIIYGVKFKPMFKPNDSNTKTILDLSKIGEFEKADMPAIT